MKGSVLNVLVNFLYGIIMIDERKDVNDTNSKLSFYDVMQYSILRQLHAFSVSIKINIH